MHGYRQPTRLAGCPLLCGIIPGWGFGCLAPLGTDLVCELGRRTCLPLHRASCGLSSSSASSQSSRQCASSPQLCIQCFLQTLKVDSVRCQSRPCRLFGALAYPLSAASVPTLQARQVGMLRRRSWPLLVGVASALPIRPLPQCGGASPAGAEEPHCRGVRHHLCAACRALCALRAPGAAADSAGGVGGSLQG